MHKQTALTPHSTPPRGSNYVLYLPHLTPTIVFLYCPVNTQKEALPRSGGLPGRASRVPTSVTGACLAVGRKRGTQYRPPSWPPRPA
jgi:hypothetical protein